MLNMGTCFVLFSDDESDSDSEPEAKARKIDSKVRSLPSVYILIYFGCLNAANPLIGVDAIKKTITGLHQIKQSRRCQAASFQKIWRPISWTTSGDLHCVNGVQSDPTSSKNWL